MVENLNNLKNLLLNVAIIQKKYDDLAEYSGEHYNVFDILGVQSDELSHSAILTNLLDANGKHGQKNIFLELFIETIKNSFKDDKSKEVFLNNFSNFDTKNSIAEKEKFAGKVNYDAEQGGRIDIIINDRKKNIIIENKIYAVDQPKQLVRYNEFDKNAPILYLTLNGKDASPDSRGTLKNGVHYVCISYQNEINVWLEQCVKEMTNKPIIRETLNQYLFLIKNLTNQSNNNKMSEEVINIMANNIESSFEVYKNLKNLKTNLFLSFIEKIKERNSDDIIINIDDNIGNIHSSISFKKIKLNNIVNVVLYFEGNDFSDVIIGASVEKEHFDNDFRYKLQEVFQSKNFGKKKDYPNWYVLYSYSLFDKINLAEFWININYENFITSFCNDLNIFIETIDKAFDSNI